MITWDDVVAIASRLPGVEQSTSYGRPALRVKGTSFCRLRTDPDALVVSVLDEEDKQALIMGHPDALFTTPHYDGYRYVLVRLDRVDRDLLEELVEDAWRIRAPKRLVAEYEALRADA